MQVREKSTRTNCSIGIIGGGLIGLAVARQALRRSLARSVTVFEKELDVGQHQSGHNSGVLHAGLYYKPGSLKARLAVTGIRRMLEFCQQNNVPHEICGKLVVAVTQDEIPRLQELFERGQVNGLQGLRWLNPEQIREREPHVNGLAAVEVPEEGIVDYPAVSQALRREVIALGGEVRSSSAVLALSRRQNQWEIETSSGPAQANYLINCAGLYCDRIMRLTGEIPTTRIIPFRGEYFTLAPAVQQLVRHLIYPVPEPKFPFLGVHYTRMIHGGVECGPNAVLALKREGYSWSDFSFQDTADALSFPGLWRFLAKYPAMSAYELRRSLDKAEFTRSLQRLIPEVRAEHLAPGQAGVRAQAMSQDGTLLQDFDIQLRAGALHLLNAPSPGATASLAIADEVLSRVPNLT